MTWTNAIIHVVSSGNTFGDRVKPSSLEVLRLIVNSNVNGAVKQTSSNGRADVVFDPTRTLSCISYCGSEVGPGPVKALV